MSYSLRDVGSYRVVGRPALFSVPACVDPSDTGNWTQKVTGLNTICAGMYQAVPQLLMRNFDDWQPTSIVVGFGGDWDQDANSDQGARQPPAFADTAVRKPIHTAAITQVTPGVDNRFSYVAVIRPDDAVTDEDDSSRPYINELGLVANNGTLLAHYVTPNDPIDNAIATRFAKTSDEWLIIKWEIEFAGAPV